MSFTDAEAQRLLRVVSEQVDRAQSKLPHTTYGVVATVDTATDRATVYLYGSTVASAGFAFPPRNVPSVGDVVRVVVDPRGDRYIDENLTGNTSKRLELRWNGGTPYLDFSNDDSTDFDARLVLESDDILAVTGADLRIATGNLLLADRPVTAKVIEFGISSGVTVYFADTAIGRTGMALMAPLGNDGVSIMSWYRNGSFNMVTGLIGMHANTMEFRGNTYSAGAASWSWFIESNSAGARLAIKSNAGFDRNFLMWIIY